MALSGYDKKIKLSTRIIDPSDTFTGDNGDAPDPLKWSITNNSASGTADIQSNKLRISLPSNSTADENVEAISTFMLVGDFDVQVDYSEISNDPPSGAFTSYPVRAALRAAGGSIWMFGVRQTAAEHGYYVNSTAGDWDTMSTFDVSGKLRFVRSGSTIKCYYWDGTQWEYDG